MQNKEHNMFLHHSALLFFLIQIFCTFILMLFRLGIKYGGASRFPHQKMGLNPERWRNLVLQETLATIRQWNGSTFSTRVYHHLHQTSAAAALFTFCQQPLTAWKCLHLDRAGKTQPSCACLVSALEIPQCVSQYCQTQCVGFSSNTWH